MIRLLAAEAHRWRARRGMWIIVGVSVLLSLLVALPMALAIRPPSGADVERATTYYEQAHADWAKNKDQFMADCQANPPPAGQGTCAEMIKEPLQSDFVPQPLKFADAASQGVEIGAGLGGLLALIAAASFIGAEYRHGTLATWLTFVPGRTRVWAAKAVVAMVAGGLLALVCETILLSAAGLSVAAFQGAGALTSAQPAIEIGLRGVALGALAGLTGQALAMLFRQTVAPTLLPLAYLILQGVTGLLSLLPGYRTIVLWLPENNVRAVLEGGAKVTTYETTVSDHGMDMKPLEQTIALGQGLAYVLVAVAVLAVGSLLVFRRRDVS